MKRAPAWTGFAIGFAIGAFDYALFRALGVDMRLAGRPVTLEVCALFAGSYAVLGFLGGRLVEARRTIAGQLAALEASQARALENEKLAAIGRLAAGVAHEVRNPLGVIRSAASVLVEGTPATDPRARAGTFIVEEVDRLDRLVRALLDYSRRLQIVPRPVDLARVAGGAVALGGEALGRRRVAVESDGRPIAAGDPDLLTQVLLGLLVNAAQATSEDGRVEVRLAAEAGDVTAEVADDGPGIAPEIRDHLFEPFHTTKPGGTGLGLAMAARVVQAHGGRIEVPEGRGAGAGGAGACFRIRLPASRESAA